ncbi:hypothetical protein RvY_12095 [Ramazzottius varieornatus]|uniref:C3H1-type domain-containing protein n=1 Tax=Ramazzottius varieornatus TaxID=947166 RepID=A0A1D1VKC4_RAMVA|nr:hypothetical protein RvY_12095 [Ramazzottius varieornatus]
MDPSQCDSYDAYLQGHFRRPSLTEGRHSGQDGGISGDLGDFFDAGYSRGAKVSRHGQQYGSPSTDPWSMASFSHSLFASDSGISTSQSARSSPVPALSIRHVPATVPRNSRDSRQKPLQKHQHPIKAVNTMYKTRPCNKWAVMGSCPYETRCQFAHGPEELRPPIMHHLYRTKPCRSFERFGFCSFGNRCDFLHVEGDAPQETDPRLNFRAGGRYDFFANDDDEPSSATVTTGFHSKWTTEGSLGDSPFSSVHSSRATSPGISSSFSSLTKDHGWFDSCWAETEEKVKMQKAQGLDALCSWDEFVSHVVE